MSGKKNQHSTLVKNPFIKKEDEKKRETGIEIIGAVPWGTHLCQFYKTKDDLIDILVPYFKAGLQNNEFCMWITSEPLHVDEAKRALQKAVKNFDIYIKNGQIEILDARQWYTKSGKFNADEVLSGWVKKEEEARKKGFDGLRLSGNTFWLEKKDWEDFTKYEEAINHVIGNYQMIAICSYSLEKCNASEIIDVVSNHQFALIKREGQWHRIESPEMKIIEEKIKETVKNQQIILDSVPALIFYKDKENRLIRTNKAFENAMGRSKEMLEGKSCFDIYPKKQAEKYWKDDKQVMKTHIAKYGIIETMNTPYGIRVMQTEKIPYFDESGNITGIIGFSVDITEKRKFEQEQQRQAQLLDEVQDGVIAVDHDFRITYWNKGAELMFGYSKVEAIGKTTRELLQPLYAPGEREKIIDELNRLGTSVTIIRTKHRNGNVIFSEVHSTRITDESDNISGYVVTYRNVTDREKAQEALRKAEFKFRTVADNTYDFEFWIDLDGTFLYASPSCKRITGYDSNDFLLNSSLRKEIVHQEDKQEFLKHVSNELTSKEPSELEYRIINKDGTIQWIYHVCQPVRDENGKFLGIRGSNRDITDRKKIEESVQQMHHKLQNTLNSITDGLLVLDHNWCYTYFSENGAKILGMRREDIIGKCVWEMFPHAKGTKFYEGYHRAVETRQPVHFEEFYPEPLNLWLECHCYPSEEGLTVYFQDITERKKLEEKVKNLLNSVQIEKERLNAVINSIQDEVWFADVKKKFTLINASALREFNLTTYEEVDVEKLAANLEVFRPDGSPRPVKEAPPLLALTGKTIKNQEEMVRTPVTNEYRWRQVSSAPVRDNDGRIFGSVTIVRDITERKKAEEQLRETSDYLENLLNYANAPIIVWDKDFKIIRFNHAFEHLTGYASKMMIGKKLDILFPPENKEESLQKINRTLTGEYWESVEIPILHKSGDIRVALWNSANIYDDSGKRLLATIAQGQDITERKQIEDKLKESEIRLNRAQELAHLGSWELNPINNQLIWSDEVYRIFGLRPQEFGATYEAFLRSVYPDDRAMVDDAYSKSLREGRDTYEIEHRVVRKNGEVRFVYEKCEHIRDKSGKIIRSVGMVHDITDRKEAEKTLQESEEKYRRIVENTTNVIMVTQPDGIISYLSPSCDEVLGHPPEELVGTNPVIFHPDDIQKVQHVLEKALNGEKGSNLEYRILTKQGKIKWISHSWSPLFIDNNLQSIISVITDVTERKIAEENIKKLNENLMHRTIELAAANKELEAFSYSVSHDLRAPLRSIDGFSQALMEDHTDILNEQAKEYLQRVRKASQRMGQLIDDMLKLSRLTRVEMTINKVDLSETATTIIEEFKKEEPTRKIDFIIHDKLMADGDANLLRILLENLLGNAWKFTKKCKRAKIEFGKTQQGKETVFFVRDNGAGFDMKYANKLFIPFQRLHDDTDYPGTGIGLGIVSRIIHRHRGRIWAEAEENKGATFYFTIGGKNNE